MAHTYNERRYLIRWMKTGFASIENSDQLHGNKQVLAGNQSHIAQHTLAPDNVFWKQCPHRFTYQTTSTAKNKSTSHISGPFVGPCFCQCTAVRLSRWVVCRHTAQELISQSSLLDPHSRGNNNGKRSTADVREWQEYWKSKHERWQNKTGPGLWGKKPNLATTLNKLIRKIACFPEAPSSGFCKLSRQHSCPPSITFILLLELSCRHSYILLLFLITEKLHEMHKNGVIKKTV